MKAKSGDAFFAFVYSLAASLRAGSFEPTHHHLAVTAFYAQPKNYKNKGSLVGLAYAAWFTACNIEQSATTVAYPGVNCTSLDDWIYKQWLNFLRKYSAILPCLSEKIECQYKGLRDQIQNLEDRRAKYANLKQSCADLEAQLAALREKRQLIGRLIRQCLTELEPIVDGNHSRREKIARLVRECGANLEAASRKQRVTARDLDPPLGSDENLADSLASAAADSDASRISSGSGRESPYGFSSLASGDIHGGPLGVSFDTGMASPAPSSPPVTPVMTPPFASTAESGFEPAPHSAGAGAAITGLRG